MGAASFIILCNHPHSTTHWIALVNIDCIEIKAQIIFLDYVSAMKGCQRVQCRLAPYCQAAGEGLNTGGSLGSLY